MKFYVLKNKFSGEGPAVTDFLHADGSKMGDAPQCPVCGSYIGMLPLLPPVRGELEVWDREFGDIAFSTGDKLLVTERFLKLYRASRLMGLIVVAAVEVIKVTSRRKLRQQPPQYYCCYVVHSRASIDDVKSGLERDRPWACPECRENGGIIRRTLRIVLEPNSWSGEDIFRPRGLSGVILTSERFKRFCDQNKISNCELIRAEQYTFE